MKPLILELFSGSCVVTNTFRKHGYKGITIDNEYKCTKKMDLLNPDWNYFKKLEGKVAVLWASPPCTAFSVASISKNWRQGKPISQNAHDGLKLMLNTIKIITLVKPKWWFVENPRGMMRKKMPMPPVVRRTVTYCKYGEQRQKPTDIWSNCWKWDNKAPCKAGDKCHEAAPRGSKTGTQGLKNAYERSKIPQELVLEILKSIEK